MGNLTTTILDFVNLNKKKLQVEKIDINNLVNTIVDEQVCLHKNRNILVKINRLSSIKGDYEMLQQLFTHLISNAIKFSDKKAQSIIEIGNTQEDNNTIFYVKDNGCGFNMKDAYKLFHVFQHLHSPNEYEGIGIGLYISNQIVNKHSGKIWAEGKEGEGASFYFSLPGKIIGG